MHIFIYYDRGALFFITKECSLTFKNGSSLYYNIFRLWKKLCALEVVKMYSREVRIILL